MNLNDEQLNNTIRELQIRTSNTPEDREQLHKILFEILGYPTHQLAHKHHRANNMGENDLLSRQHELQQQIRQKNIQSYEVCNCCGLLIRNEELEYCVDFAKLKIGMGVVLFFKNYLFNAVLFFAMFLIYAIYALATNVSAIDLSIDTKTVLCVFGLGSDSSADEQCSLSYIGAGSKVLQANDQKDDLSQIQSWLAVAFVLAWGIANIAKEHFQKKLIIEMQTKRVSAPDFSIMITQFPSIYLEHNYKQNLEQINRIFKGYCKKVNSIFSYEVVKYNVARPIFLESQHNIERRQALQKQLKQKQDVFRNWIKYRKTHLQFPIPYSNREEEYQKYIGFYSSKYDIVPISEVPLEQTCTIFLTMRSSKAMEQICSLNQPPSWKNFWNLCKNNDFPLRDVIIQRAPEPQQIKWQKIGFPTTSKYIRKALLWFVTLCLIGITLGISIGISYVDQSRVNQYVSIGISLVVTIANVGIQMAIMLLSYLQNEHISSKQQSKIAFKIGVGQLINCIGVPIVVTILANSRSQTNDKTWLKAGGLVEDVFFIGLFNILVPIGRFIDPWQLFLRIRRWWYSEPDKRLQMYGQKQLNQYYGNYDFDIGYEYAYLIKTSIFTAFFACMQPIIVLFAPIGLILYYFADKKNLLRNFQRPNYHYSAINESVDLILLFSPIAFGFGHLLVNNFIRSQLQFHQNGTLLPNWIIVAIGGIFLILVPLNLFYCCITKPEYPQWDYYQKKPIIPTDYDRMNPITKSQAIGQFESYLQQLRQKQQLPDQGQMLRLTMSNIRITNKRNTHKKQLNNDLLRSSYRNGQKPNYTNDLNKYNQYFGDQIRVSHTKRLDPSIPNKVRMEYSDNQLMGNLQNSIKFRDNQIANQDYPDINDYQGVPKYGHHHK